MQFKVGDKVRYLRRSAGYGQKGVVGTVISASDNGSIQVRHENGKEKGNEWWASWTDLESIAVPMDDTREYLAAVTGGEPCNSDSR